MMINEFPDFNRSFQMDINCPWHQYHVLVQGYHHPGSDPRSQSREYIFKCTLINNDSGTTAFAKTPFKLELVQASSKWQLEAMWGVFVSYLKIFRDPIDEMPLLINNHNEVIRHFVNWRLENGI